MPPAVHKKLGLRLYFVSYFQVSELYVNADVLNIIWGKLVCFFIIQDSRWHIIHFIIGIACVKINHSRLVALIQYLLIGLYSLGVMRFGV